MENTILQSTKTRIPYLDLLKFFAIACVILGHFYITVYRLLIGIAGSMTFFLLAPVAYQYTRSFRITQTLNHVGKCTLGIYIVQTFLLECLLHALGFYVTTTQSFFVGPLIAIAELTLCYQTVLLIKKNRYTQLLLLGIVEGKDK